MKISGLVRALAAGAAALLASVAAAQLPNPISTGLHVIDDEEVVIDNLTVVKSGGNSTLTIRVRNGSIKVRGKINAAGADGGPEVLGGDGLNVVLETIRVVHLGKPIYSGNIVFEGGEIDTHGGRGGDGIDGLGAECGDVLAEDGSNGCNGGHGGNVTIHAGGSIVLGNINTRGGAGGSGGNGGDGLVGTGKPGGYAGIGGIGGFGGSVTVSHSAPTATAATCSIGGASVQTMGGDGGAGGRGGTAGVGTSANGGWAGFGGPGGPITVAVKVLSAPYGSTLETTGGDGGPGGAGGGGARHDCGDHGCGWTTLKGSSPGKGEDGGDGGAAGDVILSASSTLTADGVNIFGAGGIGREGGAGGGGGQVCGGDDCSCGCGDGFTLAGEAGAGGGGGQGAHVTISSAGNANYTGVTIYTTGGDGKNGVLGADALHSCCDNVCMGPQGGQGGMGGLGGDGGPVAVTCGGTLAGQPTVHSCGGAGGDGGNGGHGCSGGVGGVGMNSGAAGAYTVNGTPQSQTCSPHDGVDGDTGDAPPCTDG